MTKEEVEGRFLVILFEFLLFGELLCLLIGAMLIVGSVLQQLGGVEQFFQSKNSYKTAKS